MALQIYDWNLARKRKEAPWELTGTSHDNLPGPMRDDRGHFLALFIQSSYVWIQRKGLWGYRVSGECTSCYLGYVLDRFMRDIREDYCIAKNWWAGSRNSPCLGQLSGHLLEDEHKEQVMQLGVCPRLHSGYIHYYWHNQGVKLEKVKERIVLELELWQKDPKLITVRIHHKEEFVFWAGADVRSSRNANMGKELLRCAARYMDRVPELRDVPKRR